MPWAILYFLETRYTLGKYYGSSKAPTWDKILISAISREEEERRRILEDDSAYTVSGGVNPSLWSRQEHGAQRMRMAEFRRYRDSGSDSRIVPTQSGISSLSNTICRLLDAAEVSS